MTRQGTDVNVQLQGDGAENLSGLDTFYTAAPVYNHHLRRATASKADVTLKNKTEQRATRSRLSFAEGVAIANLGSDDRRRLDRHAHGGCRLLRLLPSLSALGFCSTSLGGIPVSVPLQDTCLLAETVLHDHQKRNARNTPRLARVATELDGRPAILTSTTGLSPVGLLRAHTHIQTACARVGHTIVGIALGCVGKFCRLRGRLGLDCSDGASSNCRATWPSLPRRA